MRFCIVMLLLSMLVAAKMEITGAHPTRPKRTLFTNYDLKATDFDLEDQFTIEGWEPTVQSDIEERNPLGYQSITSPVDQECYDQYGRWFCGAMLHVAAGRRNNRRGGSGGSGRRGGGTGLGR